MTAAVVGKGGGTIWVWGLGEALPPERPPGSLDEEPRKIFS